MGIGVTCGGLAVHPQLRFEVDDPVAGRLLPTLYIQEMAKRGCHGYASFYLNGSHGEAEVEQTVAAASETFDRLADGMRRGTLDQMLECELTQDSFRRLVK
jgi:glutamate-1-semialdehyde 2,1-aminomutase